MKILSAAEMGLVDKRTADEFGVSLDTLMDRAGSAVAAFCLRRYPNANRVTVLCGKGNNGGDGFVAARVLAHAGKSVQILLLGKTEELKGEAAIAMNRLRSEAAAAPLHEVPDEAALKTLEEVIRDADLIVDAIV